MKPSLYDLLAWMFDDLDEVYSFSPMEIAIYWRLVHRCNRRNWLNPIYFACDDLRAKVKAKNAESKTAFDTARNRLKQAGLIEYEKGNGRGNITRYTIIFPQKGLVKSPKKGIQKQTLSSTLSDTLSDTLSKLPKKDKDKESKSHSPKRTVSRKQTELSESAQKFAQWFRGLLPPDRDTTENDLKAWAKTYDELVTIDKREKSEIKQVVEWARRDGFWQKNFLSAAKLRHKDKSGTKYYDVFLNQMRAENATRNNNRNASGIPAPADKYAHFDC
jgi:hypothetical protein